MLMNPDGQRHHLLLGRPDWARSQTRSGVPLAQAWAREIDDRPDDAPAWDEGRHELTLAPRAETLAPTPGESTPALDARRATAADAGGNVYWIAADTGQLMVRSHGDGRVGAFWPDPRAGRRASELFADLSPAPVAARRYVALAVTADAWLVAAFESDAGNGHDAFDLVAGGPPMTTLWPAGVTTAFDLSARAKSGMLVLDRAGKRLLSLDARLAVKGATAAIPGADLFQPTTGAPRAHARARGVFGRDLLPVIGAADPIALEALPDGRVALLTRAPDRLWLIPHGDEPVPAPVALGFAPLDLLLGEVLLRGGECGARLLVAGGTGNQLQAFRIDDAGAHATTEMFPMRRYGGRALVAIGGRASYDSGAAPGFVPVVERARRRYATEGVFVSPVFDGAVPQCVWDRLSLDACVPPGTHVLVEARAADNRDEDAVPAPWTAQPAPVMAGEAPTYWYSAAAVAPPDRRAGRGTWELLFQRLSGRYAQVRITLAADGDATPRLRALRASYPRISWSERYLPAVYREEPGPADFLDRFLANLQGTSAGIERRIVEAQALFDPRTAPAEALDWLAGWFDVALDPAWDEVRRRRFIAHAATFFGWRGTVRGIEAALALAFGADLDGTLFDGGSACCAGCEGGSGIRIVEAWLTRRSPPVVVGDPTAPVGLDLAVPGARWTPAEGNAGLAERLSTALGRPVSGVTPVPLYDAANEGAIWRQAMAGALGFVPAGGTEERRSWQRFLANRYRRISALRQAHGAGWSGFEDVQLPRHLPQTAAAQTDWLQFQGVLLAMAARAHRFSVLIPLRAGDATDAATLEGLRRFAARIVELEKPAHTVFEIRFYFAMNRLGEARLGLDTRLGQGSPAPELLPPAILGHAYAGESFIGPDGPADTPGRTRLAC
jgi:phage tail-like protein